MDRKVLAKRVREVMRYEVAYSLEYLYHQSDAAKSMTPDSFRRRLREFDWIERKKKGKASIYVRPSDVEPAFSPLYRKVVNKLNGLRKWGS